VEEEEVEEGIQIFEERKRREESAIAKDTSDPGTACGREG